MSSLACNGIPPSGRSRRKTTCSTSNGPTARCAPSEGANADALFGTAAGANVGISFGKQALYRVDGAIGPSSLRSVPYPTGDAYESIGAAIVGRLAIYGTKSGEVIGYDLDDDSFSPLATASAELLYIAGNEQEALIGSSSRSGPHPLTWLTADGTVTSAGSLPANDFLFVFDSDAIYSTNVQSGQLHATARYGNSNCSGTCYPARA